MIKKHIGAFVLVIIMGLFLVACQGTQPNLLNEEDTDNQDVIDDNTNDNQDTNDDNDDTPTEEDGERINIEGVGTFAYDASEVRPLRDDIFKEGHFSIFAILVHLTENNAFSMNYHFDESMNTYVIDDINGISDWWYYAFYDGGWREHSVYRLDHYPYKEGITIRLYEGDAETIEAVYETYREEVLRFNANGGKIIIPEVIIDGSSTSHTFYDVEVTAHNLRDDIYQDGVITAIDVIMTLADLEEITYELQWYDSIGSAEIVRSYWVHAINDDVQFGGTGFVYEAGNWDYYLFDGNHIHIPSDTRVINSPEYVRYFWIGLFETP